MALKSTARTFRLCVCLTAAAILMAALAVGMAAPRKTGRGKPTALPPKAFDKTVIDAFAADARERLGPGQPGGATPQPATEGVAPAATGGPTAAFAWSKIISAAALEDEIKSQAPGIVEAVKTPSAFNAGGNKVAGRNFATAAAMFNIISRYDGDVRWKKEAASFAAIFGSAGVNSSKVTSPEALKEAKARADDLKELIGGGKVEVSPPDDEATWEQTVARPLIMQRMDEAYQQRLKTWTASQTEFDGNLDSLEREAQVLAALARIIQDPSYEFSDADAYRQFAAQVEENCANLAAAARNKDRGAAESATALVYKACDACHGDYRGN